MKFDLDAMSLKELKTLQAQVSKKIEDFEERKKREALAAIKEQAQAMGYTLADLVDVAPVKKRKSAKPKYANPENSAETWTGRGRRPRWVDAALKAGKSLDDLAI
ncbi:H-NS histone family protein [Defluviimonas sp. D31]|uniref:H-NS histone family protein n=1 Tax=Defluviimonas sp. D31 TaxID=3083253 RepID=UPI00296E2AD4|nr:H-NS histone family protein [Defluviimonas sp. D31]MDW4549117.1 H-NS histone family protein [Defluviimonas sp. D31]